MALHFNFPLKAPFEARHTTFDKSSRRRQSCNTSSSWWEWALKAKILCTRTKSSSSTEINKNDENLLETFCVIYYRKSWKELWRLPRHFRLCMRSLSSFQIFMNPLKIWCSGRWRHIYFREDRRRWHLSTISSAARQNILFASIFCCASMRSVLAEKGTHDSIVRLCGTRECLHAKKTRSNSFGIQAFLHSWMEI